MNLKAGYNYCPDCGKAASEPASPFCCAACGYEQKQEEAGPVSTCYNCGGSDQHGSVYCPSCGYPFTLPAVVSRSPFDGPDEITAVVTTTDSLARTILRGPDEAETEEDAGDASEATSGIDEGHHDTSLLPQVVAWKYLNTERVFESLSPPRLESLPAATRAASPTAVFAPSKDPLSYGSSARSELDEAVSGQYASLIKPGRAPLPPSARRVPMFTDGATIAGRYRITRSLGSGGFASIYLVTDSEDYLQEEIVLKLVNESVMRELLSNEGEGTLNTHDDLIRAWRSKLKAWKVISEQAPNYIVRLLGVPRIVFERESYYSVGMVMEYMPGGDLWQYFQKNGAPRSREQLTEMMRLFLSACRTVSILHANGLLHRDIKPSNFLLNLAKTQCKLSDFELITEAEEQPGKPLHRVAVGTPIYMAPECFDANYSIQSDIFALGATLYHLLTGEHPRSNLPDFHAFSKELRGHRPVELTLLNPLVSSELNEAVLWCLADDPAARPASVGELEDELTRLGLTDEAVNTAPVNLARLLLTQLPADEVRDLVESMEENGFQSASAEMEQRQRDIIEEYCYTASPYDVLKDNCTNRQLKALTKSLGLKEVPAVSRDDLIEQILTSVGFLVSAREVPGIEATRTFLENLRLNLAHATTMDECVGMVQAGLLAVERTVDLLLSFYGQLVQGTKLPGFLKKVGNGKPPERLTFGEKLGALRRLCSDAPPATLPSRVRKVFKFPLIPAEVFDRLGEVVKHRNLSAHAPHESTRHSLAFAQRSGRQLLEHAVTCLTDLAQNTNVPRVVQIVSRQDDIYGRHFYLGRDDHGRTERIFTPLPLNVGQLYLFFPLTNPARINPLIFPFETPRPQPRRA